MLRAHASAGAPALTAADFANSPALRQRIVNELRKTTRKADEVAELLEEGKVGLNFLGDDLFRYLGHSDSNAIYNPATRQIYLRRSDPNFFSTVVHEGTHALDHANRASRTLFSLELRAHLFQRQYEMFVNGFSARYPTIKSVWDRVLADYASPLLHKIFQWPN